MGFSRPHVGNAKLAFRGQSSCLHYGGSLPLEGGGIGTGPRSDQPQAGDVEQKNTVQPQSRVLGFQGLGFQGSGSGSLGFKVLGPEVLGPERVLGPEKKEK